MSGYTTDELAALTEFIGSIMESFAASLSEQLVRVVEIDPPTVSSEPVDELAAGGTTVLQTTFSFPQIGPDEGIIAFAASEAHVLANLMEGGDGNDAPINLLDEQMARLAEGMQGIVAGLGNAIGNALDKLVQPGTCATAVGPLSPPPCFAISEEAIHVAIPYHVPGVLDSRIQVFMTPAFARQLVPVSTAPAAGSPGSLGQLDVSLLTGGTPISCLDAAPPTSDTLPRGMELIMDIPLDVTVELGRVRMLIKDVLALSAGSIVELQRVAGEPVDLLVNGRLVAKGEVVVIDDNFGVRLTEIVGQADRVAVLGRR